MDEETKGRKKKTRKKYNLSLDPDVVEPLHERLKETGISLSGYVNVILSQSWEMMKNLPNSPEEMTIGEFTEFWAKFAKLLKK